MLFRCLMAFSILALISCATATARIIYVDQSLISNSLKGKTHYSSLVSAAKVLESGDTLLISPGVYRESLILENYSKINKTGLTIKGSDNGQVIIKGSDIINGWELHKDDIYVKHGWDIQPQQVFIDNEALKQIGGTIFRGYPEDRNGKLFKQFKLRIWPDRFDNNVQSMPDGSFKYEPQDKTLYLRLPNVDDISKHIIEVAVRPHSLLVRGWDNVTVENLTFQHSNTSTGGRNGAVSLWGDGHVLRNLAILDTDSVGLHLVGNNIRVLNSEISRAGRLGVLARGMNHLYKGNKTNHNNTRGFNTFWEAGGMKFVGDGGLRDSIVTKHESLNNQGDGIWFDWFNHNNEISNSLTAFNQGFGIHYEASSDATIKGNIAIGNKHRGIYLPHSSNSIVSCNLAAFNGMEGIVVIDEGRRSSEGDLKPSNNRILGNVIAWNSKRVVARPGLILPEDNESNISDMNLFLSEYPRARFSLGWPRLLNPLIRGLDKWQSISKQDAHSWQYRMKIPNDIDSAINERKSNINWKELYDTTNQFTFPESNLSENIECKSPGPFAINDAYTRNP